ncbi:MAG TPA: hypothetical protein VH595_07770 [Verrucomicrobiae bacterium]|jgi:hypothetical protein|nr:hypothetical protein [Verrucomicrobiae bacterium]
MSSFLGNCLSGLPKQTDWTFSLDGSSGTCADCANALIYLNAQTPDWGNEYNGTFNTPASTVPDSESSYTIGSPGSVDIYSSWNCQYPTFIKNAILCKDPTLYCVAAWTVGGTFGVQNTCILSGVPAVCGVSGPAFEYNLPLPSIDGCDAVNNPSIYYGLYDDAGWAAACSEGEIPGDLQDPSACNDLPNDPFDDEDP